MTSSTYTSEAAGSAGLFPNSDEAELSFSAETKSFHLIVIDKHHGGGVFGEANSGESEALTKPPTVPSPGPLPAKGKFYYDSWNDVLQSSTLQFVSGTDKNGLSIVFSNGDKEVAKYLGGSDGIEGGNGYFMWIQ